MSGCNNTTTFTLFPFMIQIIPSEEIFCLTKLFDLIMKFAFSTSYKEVNFLN